MKEIQGRNSRQDPGYRECSREHRRMLFMSFLQCSSLAAFLIQPSLSCLGMLPTTYTGLFTLIVNLGNAPQTWLHVNLMEIIPQLMFLLPRCVHWQPRLVIIPNFIYSQRLTLDFMHIRQELYQLRYGDIYIPIDWFWYYSVIGCPFKPSDWEKWKGLKDTFGKVEKESGIENLPNFNWITWYYFNLKCIDI